MRFSRPATYRTNAVVVVDSASPAALLKLPEPLEAARRLSEGVLDRPMLDNLSRERASSAAARRARSGHEQRSPGTRDRHERCPHVQHQLPGHRQSARATCLQPARASRRRDCAACADRSERRSSRTDLRRQQRTQELAAFLALHPQVASEASPSGDRSVDKDPVLLRHFTPKRTSSSVRSPTWRAVTARITRTLNLRSGMSGCSSAACSRSTRGSPLVVRPWTLHPAPNALPPEVQAEWKRLLELVTQSSVESDSHTVPDPRCTTDQRGAPARLAARPESAASALLWARVWHRLGAPPMRWSLAPRGSAARSRVGHR